MTRLIIGFLFIASLYGQSFPPLVTSGPYSNMPTVTGDGTLNAGNGVLVVNKIAGQPPGNMYPQNAPTAAPCLSTVGTQVTNSGCAVNGIPQAASSAGYNTLTYYTALAPADVDTGGTYAAGYALYLQNFYSPHSTSAGVSFQTNQATLGASGNTSWLFSAGGTGTLGAGGWHGSAFGGGFYASASIRFNPYNSMVLGSSSGIPGFPGWGFFPLESVLQVSGSLQWPGQATGYIHYSEIDVMEYDVEFTTNNLLDYGATIHDWYGGAVGPCAPISCSVDNSTSGGSSFRNAAVIPSPLLGTVVGSTTGTTALTLSATAPSWFIPGVLITGPNIVNGTTIASGSGTSWVMSIASTATASAQTFTGYNLSASTFDYNQWHDYGVLWIPATGSTNGSITYYLDGVATSSSVYWTQYVGSATSPPPGLFSVAPWTFGVTDTLHWVLDIGTGNSQPMNVRNIQIWQANTAGNIVQ